MVISSSLARLFKRPDAQHSSLEMRQLFNNVDTLPANRLPTRFSVDHVVPAYEATLSAYRLPAQTSELHQGTYNSREVAGNFALHTPSISDEVVKRSPILTSTERFQE